MTTAAHTRGLLAAPEPRCPVRRRLGQALRFDPPLRVDQLANRTRRALGDVLYPIFRASYGDLDRAVVCDEIIFRAGGLLCLLRGADGDIVGFGTACVREITVEGTVHGVFEGGIYCRPGIRGGLVWNRTALRIALAERVRHPRRPLHVVNEMMTPVSYRLVHRAFARSYPAPGVETPPALAAVLLRTIEARGLIRPTDHPYVVSYPDPARALRADDIQRSETLRGDRYVDAYLRWNPAYAEGHLLCTITPLGWRDLLAAAAHQATGSRRRRRAARISTTSAPALTQTRTTEPSETR